VGMMTFVIPAYFGMPGALCAIICALICRLNRIWISVKLLLAHIFVFALNFWLGAIACC
jgi:hypothetical protein